MKPQTQELQVIDFIDLDILQRIQDTFAKAMSVAAVTVDRYGAPITKTSNFSRLCLMIRSTSKGLKRCYKSDADGGQKAIDAQRPVNYICPGGLMDAAAPLIIDGKYVGAIMCGQTIFTDAGQEFFDRIIKSNEVLGLSPKEIEIAAHEIVPLPRERFNAALEMLSITANYVIEKSASNIAQAKLLKEAQERAVLQVALKEAQLRAFKAQINPHFLFNSLTLLGYTALEEDAPRTEEIAYSLSDLLRYSLRNISTSVALGEEIEMIEHYLAIQKIGFGDRLDYTVHIHTDLKEFVVPGMILQPLVENAVLHGAAPLRRRVTIKVRAYIYGPTVVIEIADDGIGMPADLVQAINSGYFSSDGKSLGLQNVIQRLIGEYGEAFSIRVDSEPGLGTRFLLYIPYTHTAIEINETSAQFFPIVTGLSDDHIMLHETPSNSR